MHNYKKHLTLNILYDHINFQDNGLICPPAEGVIDGNVDIKCKTKIVFISKIISKVPLSICLSSFKEKNVIQMTQTFFFLWSNKKILKCIKSLKVTLQVFYSYFLKHCQNASAVLTV